MDDASEYDDDFSSEDEGKITQEDITLGDYMNEDEIPDYQLRNNVKQAESKQEIPFSVAASLHEYLLEQLGECELSNEEKKTAEYIIGSIDENGYLDRSLSAISDDLIFQQNVDIPVHLLKINWLLRMPISW